MSNFSPTQTDYHNFTHILAKFTSLTQIKTLFYGFSGILLQDDFVYLNQDAIQQHLADEALNQFIVFPVSLDEQLWGAILCDTHNVSKQRLTLTRNYLTDELRQAFANTPVTIQIWEALSANQLQQLGYFQNFLPQSNCPESMAPASSRPTTASPATTSAATDDAYHSVTLAVSYIQKHIYQALSLKEVAEAAYLSPSYLSRLFKKYLHVNFVTYVNNQKIAVAQEKLALTLTPINQISTRLGFSQTSYFTKIFKRKTGMTPSEYRQHNHGVQKIYTIPRDLDWGVASSIYDVSRGYFQNHDINYHTDAADSAAYINQIGDLTDANNHQGWLYTVDGQPPTQSAGVVSTKDKSVIQWLYTKQTEND